MSATAVSSQILSDEKTMSKSAPSCADRRCGGGRDAEDGSVPRVSESQEESEQLVSDHDCKTAIVPTAEEEEGVEEAEEDEEVPEQLQAGPPPPPPANPASPQPPCEASAPASVCEADAEGEPRSTRPFAFEETFFIFDYDDTILPSTWLQRQGLRLDSGSQPTAEQRETLAQVAQAAGLTLRAARQQGTVVLVTNAERGWIELSCRKFLPMLAPMLENVKLVSARTTYDSAQCSTPLQWKLCAFAEEVTEHFGFDVTQDPAMRKNILSLGDSPHEREALLMAAAPLPNCSAKSMKFVERPSVAQICEQHKLIFKSFEQVVHHGGNLDLCIRCP